MRQRDYQLYRQLNRLIKPRSLSEDSRRQEFILNCLLLGIIVLSSFSLLRLIFDAFTLGPKNHGQSPLVLLVVTLAFIGLFYLSRRGGQRIASIILVGVTAVAGFACLYLWGIALPTGLLVLILSIVMSSILISTRFSLLYTGGVSVVLLTLGYLESAKLSHPDMYWINTAGGIGDAITFIFIFLVIAIVSWLSNREIEQSLARARKSERALQEERDLLEARVIERTKQLEEAQQEKIMQLYRFADFGRISSGLLHDIINPLTAVSLNLEQLSTKRRSDLVLQAIEGIKYIEHFVQAARKQIQNPQESSSFSPRTEITEIATTLASKLRANHIDLKLDIKRASRIFGSQIKFHQLVSNLLSNAIDAYDDSDSPHKLIRISLEETARHHILKIQDFGQGIHGEALTKIFEPFYTTKPTEKGTGIGLFIARRIVEEDFLGTIKASSSESNGTTFTIQLPKHD